MKMHAVDEMLVRCSVVFYSEAWKQRNKIMPKLEKFKSHVIKQHKNTKELIMNENKPSIKKDVRNQGMDTQ